MAEFWEVQLISEAPHRMTLREQYGRQASAWEEEQSPVVSFVCDSGEIYGFPFFSLQAARVDAEGQALILQFSAIIEIHGPKVLEFYKAFARGRACWIKADGDSILSVKVHVPTEQEPEPPAEVNGSVG
jgi:hypothetical protein